MKAVYKYPCPFSELVDDTRMYTMPKGAEIIHVGMQDEVVTFWAVVDPNAELEERCITIVGTGMHFSADRVEAKYLGTAMEFGYSFVWHLFELCPKT